MRGRVIIVLARAWLVGLVAVLGWACAGAATPVVRGDPRMGPMNLVSAMETVRLRASDPADPDALWAAPGGTRPKDADVWELHAGERWVGRMSLGGSRGVEDYVIQVPMAQVDLARIWWRSPGGPWRAAQAGDRVPISAWPFANPFPAFMLSVGVEPVDVVLAVENAAAMRTPVTLLPDALFRENLVRRANLSGIVMGLGGMVMIVCVLGAIGYGGRPRWILAGVSLWTLFGIIASNGYLGVWFTGELTAFNDWSRSFAGLVLSGLMLLLCTEALDGLHLRRRERVLACAAPGVAVAYAVVQIAWLPPAWRVPALVVASVLSICLAAVLCLVNHLRGGRHDGWIAGAIASMSLAPVVVFVVPDEVANLDLRAAMLAASVYLALLLIRQALMLRDRYGRDVLGRAAIGSNRDPLTALWSYDGFQQRHAEAALREAAGQGTSSVMLLALPGLDHAAVQHGSALTERALVRFAAAMQGLLGQRWAVARVSRTRFAAISLRPMTAIDLADAATQVLSHCSRITVPLNLVADFDLRIACSRRRIADTPMPELLRELKQAALALDHRKRIAYLQPMPAATLSQPQLAELAAKP